MLERVPNAFLIGEGVRESDDRGTVFDPSGLQMVVEVDELLLIVHIRVRRRGDKAKMIVDYFRMRLQNKLLELDGNVLVGMENRRNGDQFRGFLEDGEDRVDDHFFQEKLVVKDKI